MVFSLEHTWDKWKGHKDPGSLKLVNIGCGSKPFSGFTNVDSREDLVGIECPGVDTKDLSCFADGEVDYIYACHILEHIPRCDTFKVLLEWNRVLSLGGMVRISVPDWDATVQYYNETGDLENLLNWIYGGRENEVKNEFTHKRIFNLANLRSLLYEAGFKRVEEYDPRLTMHSHYDDFAMAYRPHMDFDNGIGMSLNVQAVK